jgi:hypothetical protein
MAEEEIVSDSFEYRASVGFRLLASESGFLRSIDVASGDRVLVGEQLGLVTSNAEEVVDGVEDATSEFRVVGNYLEEGRRR